MNRLYYKTPGYGTTAQRVTNTGTWVEVGGNAWKASWRVTRGTAANPDLTAKALAVTDLVLTLQQLTLLELKQLLLNIAIVNAAGIAGVTAAVVDGSIEFYADATSEVKGLSSRRQNY